MSVPDKIAAEKEAYAAAVKAGPAQVRAESSLVAGRVPPPDCRGLDSPRALHPAQVALTSLGMRARFVHGDAVIADSQTDGSFEQACDKFEQWVHKEFLATAAA